MKKETKSIKESKTIYVIEHWHPLFDETHYVIADDLDAETTDETGAKVVKAKEDYESIAEYLTTVQDENIRLHL